MVYAPLFPVETQLPYPFISSGERINLSSYVVVNIKNKFSHFLICNWLYLNFSKGKNLRAPSLGLSKTVEQLASYHLHSSSTYHTFIAFPTRSISQSQIRELRLDIEKEIVVIFGQLRRYPFQPFVILFKDRIISRNQILIS